MPSLLRESARRSSGGRTRRRSTVRGTGIRWRAPSILIHMHRVLWMWAAIIRTVRRGLPGRLRDHNSGGRFSMRYTVTRWLVCHAAISSLPALEFRGTRARLQIQRLADPKSAQRSGLSNLFPSRVLRQVLQCERPEARHEALLAAALDQTNPLPLCEPLRDGPLVQFHGN